MTEQIKPCPFCTEKYVTIATAAGGAKFITCVDCGADGPAATTEAAAIAAWNAAPRPETKYIPRTELVRQLLEIRARILAAGYPPLTLDEINGEAAPRPEPARTCATCCFWRSKAQGWPEVARGDCTHPVVGARLGETDSSWFCGSWSDTGGDCDHCGMTVVMLYGIELDEQAGVYGALVCGQCRDKLTAQPRPAAGQVVGQ